MTTASSLRLVKTWEGDGPFLVLHVQSYGAFAAAKKFYLIVDANQRSQGIRVVDAKPEDLKVQGAFVALVRKHAPTGGLGGIFRGKDGAYWLPVLTRGGGPAPFFLHLSATMPPELSFIARDDDGTGLVLVRKSSQGTFTKRRTFAGDLPDLLDRRQFDDLTAEILGEGRKADGPAALDPTNPPPGSVAGVPTEGATTIPEFRRDAIRRLTRKQKTIRKYREKTAAMTPSSAEIVAQERLAMRLKANTHRLSEGLHEILLPADADDEATKVQLDPDLSAGANVDLAFVTLKKLRRAAAVGAAEEKKAAAEAWALGNAITTLKEKSLGERDVGVILRGFGIAPLLHINAPKAEKSPVASPFKLFLLPLPKAGRGASEAPPRALRIMVGKGATENDELCRQARSDDWWFHAVGQEGGHVILPARQLPNGLTPELIRAGAILALHHSKAKDNWRGEVYVTQRRHLRKKKGLPPGLWLVEKAETVFVAYSKSELQDLLDEKGAR